MFNRKNRSGPIRVISFFLLLTFGLAAVPVDVHADNYERDAAIAVGANIIFNGVIGAAGAYFNDKPVLKGFYYGALGGSLIAAAKYTVGRNEKLAWPAKIVNSVGTGIVFNSSMGNDPFRRIGMDIGFLYLELKDDGPGYYLNPQLEVGSVLGLLMMGTSGEDLTFNYKKSLQYGLFVFNVKEFENESVLGSQVTNVITLRENVSVTTDRHELVHYHQYVSGAAMSSLMYNPGGMKRVKRITDKVHIRIDNAMAAGSYSVFASPLLPYLNRPKEIESFILTGKWDERKKHSEDTEDD